MDDVLLIPSMEQRFFFLKAFEVTFSNKKSLRYSKTERDHWRHFTDRNTSESACCVARGPASMDTCQSAQSGGRRSDPQLSKELVLEKLGAATPPS